MRSLHSAEQAVTAYNDALERCASTRSCNPGERVRRPKDLECPKCRCRSWKMDDTGHIVCAGKKCRQVWPSEWVSSRPEGQPRRKPPAELSLYMLCDIGLLFAERRRSSYEPRPLTRWERTVLFLHAELGRSSASGRGRIVSLTAALQERYPWSYHAPWEQRNVARLLRDAKRATEARLQWRGMLETT